MPLLRLLYCRGYGSAAPGAVWDKVATTIGAEGFNFTQRSPKKQKKVATQKRTALEEKATKKKALRRSAQKKQLEINRTSCLGNIVVGTKQTFQPNRSMSSFGGKAT